MNKNDKKTIILISIIFILVILLIGALFMIKINNTSNIKNNETNKGTKIEENKNNLNKQEQTQIEEKEPNNNESNNVVSNNQKPVNNTENQKEYTENDIVLYANELNNMEYNEKNEKTIKSRFVTLVDFIFYDGKIYNKTFKELTNETKIKLLSLIIKIDSKIDNKYPNYKNTISDKYHNIKEHALEAYLNKTTEVCNNNETTCKSAKEELNVLKNNFNITWNFVKTIAKNNVTKLSNWYKVWRTSDD